MWTIVLHTANKSLKYCIGVFKTEQEAKDWALKDGWAPETFTILKLYE